MVGPPIGGAAPKFLKDRGSPAVLPFAAPTDARRVTLFGRTRLIDPAWQGREENDMKTALFGLTLGLAGVAGLSFAGDGKCGSKSGGCDTEPTVMTSVVAEGNIVETAVAAGDFKTLVAAVKAADLVETLSGEGPFTVFAPTDAAFAKLPEGTLDSLLKPENKAKLQGILTYHVVAGGVGSGEVVKLTSAKTVQGEPVTIEVRDGKVFLNGNVQVIKTDIKTKNGVIHVIDGVLLPPAQ